MVLHILLDSNTILEPSEQDIVLVNNNCGKIKTGAITRVVDYRLINEDDSIYRQLNEWFISIGSKGQINNSAYNDFFRHIFAVLHTIEDIRSQYNIKEIILYGGSEHIYVTSINAEGEGDKVHYKTNWLVNSIINKQYKYKCRVLWKNKKPAFIFYFHHLFRYLKALTITIVTAIEKNGKTKPISDHRDEEIMYISYVDLQLQYRHLKSLFAQVPDKSCMFYTFSPSLSNAERDVVYIPKLKFFRVIKIFSKYWQMIKKCRLPILEYKSSFLVKELNYLYLRYYLILERKKNIVKSFSADKKLTFVTDMTFGMDVISCHELAHEMQWDHINVQYVTMARILYPNVELADVFYMFSRRSFELYSKYSNTYRYYLPLKQNLNRYNSNKLTLTVFMQPDAFAEDYINYFKLLLPAIAKVSTSINLIIKPHYRQNRMEELIDIVKPYSFVTMAGLNDSCEELLNKSSFAVSIHSSVIFEALINNVMCIVYNPNGKYDDAIYHNDICYPEVNFVVTEALETMKYIEEFEKYNSLYYRRRNVFLEQNNCNQNISELL